VLLHRPEPVPLVRGETLVGLLLCCQVHEFRLMCLGRGREAVAAGSEIPVTIVSVENTVSTCGLVLLQSTKDAESLGARTSARGHLRSEPRGEDHTQFELIAHATGAREATWPEDISMRSPHEALHALHLEVEVEVDCLFHINFTLTRNALSVLLSLFTRFSALPPFVQPFLLGHGPGMEICPPSPAYFWRVQSICNMSHSV
jgi:hypothetical protein